MATKDWLSHPEFQRLKDARLLMLQLHKALLNVERAEYEQTHGKIRSNTEFFHLVIDHEWFSWLRPISQFIVQMDDVLMSKSPVEPAQATDLIEGAKALLQPAEHGGELESRYYQAIQKHPDIATMHRQMTALLGDRDP